MLKLFAETLVNNCMNCGLPAQSGSVFCKEHSSDSKPATHRGARTFLFSMVATAIVAVVVVCCYVTAHALGFSWASVFH